MAVSGTRPNAFVTGYTESGDADVFVARLDGSVTTPPDTLLLADSNVLAGSNTATFYFASLAVTGVSNACRRRSPRVHSVRVAQPYPLLANGQHVFRVRAIDQFGNVDPIRCSTRGPSTPTRRSRPSTADPLRRRARRPRSSTFSSSKPGSTFTCALDYAQFTACTSPKSYTMLGEYHHIFSVRATDADGSSDLAPATRQWTVDLTPPTTAIGGGPAAQTTTRDATFEFSSNEATATFACRLDDGPAEPCTAPRAYLDLADGPHTFGVAAVDAAGNADATPAVRSWTIETGPPQTTIVSAPPAQTASSAATFALAADEPATFSCRIDGGAWASCTSPATYAPLGDGVHVFEARATDSVSKLDETPASWSWTVDLTPPDPVVQHRRPPRARTAPRRSSSPGRRRPTRSPASTATSCASTASLTQTVAPPLCSPATCSALPPPPLADGPHTWQVRAVDRSATRAPSASRSFTVDAAAAVAVRARGARRRRRTSDRRPPLSWQAAVDAGHRLRGLRRRPRRPDRRGRARRHDAGLYPGADLAEGAHRWHVVARDAYGNERASAEQRFIVDVTAPVAALTAAPNPSLVGRIVTFDAAGSSDAASAIVRYEWDLDGDGTFERDTGASPTTAHSLRSSRGRSRCGPRQRPRRPDGGRARSISASRAPAPPARLGISINDAAAYTNDPEGHDPRDLAVLRDSDARLQRRRLQEGPDVAAEARTPWTLDSTGADRLPKLLYVRFVRGLDERDLHRRHRPRREPADGDLRAARAKAAARRCFGSAPATAACPASRASRSPTTAATRSEVPRHPREAQAHRRAGERPLNVRKRIYVRVRDRAGSLSAWRIAQRLKSR